MRFLRVAGTVLLVLGCLALLACGLIWLLPQVTWSVTADWLSNFRALVETPASAAPLQWLQAVGLYCLERNTNALYIACGVALLGLSLLLLGQERPARSVAVAAQSRHAAVRPTPRRSASPSPAGDWRNELPYRNDLLADEGPVLLPPTASDEPFRAAYQPERPALQLIPQPATQVAPQTAPREEEPVACPVCHTLNNARAYYCRHCKSDLPERQPRRAEAPPPAEELREPAAYTPPQAAYTPQRGVPAPEPAYAPPSPAFIPESAYARPAPLPEEPTLEDPTPEGPTLWPEEALVDGATPSVPLAEVSAARPMDAPEPPRKPLSAPPLGAGPEYAENELLTPVRLSSRIISTMGVRK